MEIQGSAVTQEQRWSWGEGRERDGRVCCCCLVGWPSSRQWQVARPRP